MKKTSSSSGGSIPAADREAAANAGVTKTAGPKVKPWGQTVAYVRDPDGVLVEIAGEM